MNTLWDKRNNLRDAANEWIESNHDIMVFFERFALAMLRRKKRFGIKFITERVRWEVITNFDSMTEEFKINNNHAPYIARWLIDKHPRLADYIRCRKTKDEK